MCTMAHFSITGWKIAYYGRYLRRSVMDVDKWAVNRSGARMAHRLFTSYQQGFPYPW